MSEITRRQKNIRRNGIMFLTVIIEAFEHFDHNSIFYSQNTWLKQLKRSFGYDIKRRQLNNVFLALEKIGILKRYRRHIHDQERGYVFRSTRYFVDVVGWRMAAHYGCCTWKKCFQMIGAIKKGVQAKFAQVEKWVTPSWMKDYKAPDEEPKPTPPDPERPAGDFRALKTPA